MTSPFMLLTVRRDLLVCPLSVTEVNFPGEYFADVAKVYQEEIKELYELGCRESSLCAINTSFLIADHDTRPYRKYSI